MCVDTDFSLIILYCIAHSLAAKYYSEFNQGRTK